LQPDVRRTHEYALVKIQCGLRVISDPKVRPDVGGLLKEKAKQLIDEEKKKLDDKVKDKLQDKLTWLFGG
jgi:hypothetical protein